MLNNHKDSSCAAAEQLISYLYDEAAQPEKAKFEAHLKNCSACADELAGFGFVRSSVLEWRDGEFSNLATPSIEIPSRKLVSADSWSWLSNFSRIFSFNPAAALAVLTICIGLVLFALNFSNNNEIAEIDNKNAAENIASPTVEKVSEQSKEIAADNDSEKTLAAADSKLSASKSENLPIVVKSEKRAAPNRVVVKTAKNNIQISESALVAKQPVKENNKENKKSPSVQKSLEVPNLMALEDDEDKSVRLADLFDELDAK